VVDAQRPGEDGKVPVPSVELAFGEDVVNDAGELLHRVVPIFKKNACAAVEEQLQLVHRHLPDELGEHFVLDDQHEQVVDCDPDGTVDLTPTAVLCHQLVNETAHLHRPQVGFLVKDPLLERLRQVLEQTVEQRIRRQRALAAGRMASADVLAEGRLYFIPVAVVAGEAEDV
jgi:hypothetical protein